MDYQTKIIANKSPWNSDSIEIAILSISGNQVSYAENITVRSVEEGVSVSPALKLSKTEAQSLMDSLWDCGLRPSEGSGSAGALLATQNHLKDMQKYADRLLYLVEKSHE